MRAVVLLLALSLTGCTERAEPRPGPVQEGKEGRKENQPGKLAAKVYKSPAELFAGIPKDAQPRLGDDSEPERVACRNWLKKHRVGEMVEWKATIGLIKIDDGKGQEGAFLVAMQMIKPHEGIDDPPYVWSWGKPVLFGRDACQVSLDVPDKGQDRAVSDYAAIYYGPVDSDTAKKLRGWKDKVVTLRATILDATVRIVRQDKKSEPPDSLHCILAISNPTIDGYSPPILKRE